MTYTEVYTLYKTAADNSIMSKLKSAASTVLNAPRAAYQYVKDTKRLWDLKKEQEDVSDDLDYRIDTKRWLKNRTIPKEDNAGVGTWGGWRVGNKVDGKGNGRHPYEILELEKKKPPYLVENVRRALIPTKPQNFIVSPYSSTNTPAYYRNLISNFEATGEPLYPDSIQHLAYRPEGTTPDSVMRNSELVPRRKLQSVDNAIQAGFDPDEPLFSDAFQHGMDSGALHQKLQQEGKLEGNPTNAAGSDALRKDKRFRVLDKLNTLVASNNNKRNTTA